jgi:hypothetical protein
MYRMMHDSLEVVKGLSASSGHAAVITLYLHCQEQC